mmetsp:Transcript_110880/g.357955  ORF Transcript_110880/g.357955 Transcript_110880/m.357955 type:complete len:457 (-) Transcript_110880:667-2037(-)
MGSSCLARGGTDLAPAGFCRSGDFCSIRSSASHIEGVRCRNSPMAVAASAPASQRLRSSAADVTRAPKKARCCSSRVSTTLLPMQKELLLVEDLGDIVDLLDCKKSESSMATCKARSPRCRGKVAERGGVPAARADGRLWSMRQLQPKLSLLVCCKWPHWPSGSSSTSNASRCFGEKSAKELDLETVTPSLRQLKLKLPVFRLPPKRMVEVEAWLKEVDLCASAATGVAGPCWSSFSPLPRGLAIMQPRSFSICSWEKRVCFVRVCTRFLIFPPTQALLPGFCRSATSCVSTSQPSDAIGGSSCPASSLCLELALKPGASSQELAIGALQALRGHFPQSVGLLGSSQASLSQEHLTPSATSSPSGMVGQMLENFPRRLFLLPAGLVGLLAAGGSPQEAWQQRLATKRPPNSTDSTMLPACVGIRLSAAPTQSPCVTRRKFRRAMAPRCRYVRKRLA